MTRWLTRWRIARLERKLEAVLAEEQRWYTEQVRFARAAYDVPNMHADPMHWARLQTRSNWAGHHRRTCIKASRKIEQKLADLKEPL